MVRLDVQKRILEKALKKQAHPFVEEAGSFHWSGATRVVSRQTERAYEVTVEISVTPNRRVAAEVAACLCKPEGVRFEDLLIVSLIDPKAQGTIRLKGLPRQDETHEFIRFLKKVEEAVTAS